MSLSAAKADGASRLPPEPDGASPAGPSAPASLPPPDPRAGLRRVCDANASVLRRGRQTERAVQRAVERCEELATDLTRVQAELRQLPALAQQVSDMLGRTAAACAQIELLEDQLTEVTVAHALRAEARWRKEQLEALHAHEEGRRRELQQLRAAMERQAQRKQREAREERQAEFGRQFAADQEYMRLHGEHGLRASRAPTDVPPAAEPAVSLADVAPAPLAPAGELDDFYAS